MNTVLSPWLVYLITRLDDLRIICTAFCAVGALALLLATTSYFINKSENDPEAEIPTFITHARKLGERFLVLGLLGVALIPTTRQACATVVIPKIVNNTDIQEVGQEFLNLAKEWMRTLSTPEYEDKN